MVSYQSLVGSHSGTFSTAKYQTIYFSGVHYWSYFLNFRILSRAVGIWNYPPMEVIEFSNIPSYFSCSSKPVLDLLPIALRICSLIWDSTWFPRITSLKFVLGLP